MAIKKIKKITVQIILESNDCSDRTLAMCKPLPDSQSYNPTNLIQAIILQKPIAQLLKT